MMLLLQSFLPFKQVMREQLEPKVVVLHFEYLTPDYNTTWLSTAHLTDIYNELLSDVDRPFEVVFIAVGDGKEDEFRDMFCSMPWTAVPFSDSVARKQLAKKFIASESRGFDAPASIVISNTGVIMQHNAISLFQAYGAAGYPFSKQKIEHLISQDDRARYYPSLTALLASPQRDYLINNKGHKVNISELEDKTVILYLYESGCTKALTARLKDAYKVLVEEEKMKLEVVLVYIYDSWNTLGRTNEKSFMQEFGTMPWLALPFRDSNCKKLQRVYLYPSELGGPQPDPSLVVIGPYGQYFEPFGASDVLMKFGSRGYPFTRKRGLHLQVEAIKKVNLSMLWDPEPVFIRGCGSEVPCSDIVSKGVIVFCDAVQNELYIRFKIKLQEVYQKKRGQSDEFEVIHIGSKKGQEVPWLRLHPDYPYKDSTVRKILHDIFHYGYGILVFDHDGKVVRATSNPHMEREDEFPFHYGRFETEIGFDLIERFHWDFWD
ncbi:probable nucleoredoxin 1 isoform X3 [Daucus carota subsp. sativus]|uniref:probable nucleoredoxin 1 isoform X3 n=1 Tax=Daucus carota subsp. sativus TaxID=79200 RepID=UPI003083728F